MMSSARPRAADDAPTVTFETPVAPGTVSSKSHFRLANAAPHALRVTRVDVDGDASFQFASTALPIDVPPHESVRLALICAPARSAAAGAVEGRLTISIELARKRRRRVLVVVLRATVGAPVAAKRLTGTPPAATAQHAKLFDRAREKQALQLLQQQQQQQLQQRTPDAVAATPADSLASLSGKRADEAFRRLERRLADIESQISVVLDLLRQLHARPAAAASAPASAVRRGSTEAFNSLLPDDAIDDTDDDDGVADNALPNGDGGDDDDDDDRHSDYSRPFYGSRSGNERDAVTTPPPPAALSLGGTKSGATAAAANSWQRYVNRVGEFSPTLARMAQDFELQQLQTPARRRIDALRLPESPANQRPNRRDIADDVDDLFATDLLIEGGGLPGEDEEEDDGGNDEVSF